MSDDPESVPAKQDHGSKRVPRVTVTSSYNKPISKLPMTSSATGGRLAGHFSIFQQQIDARNDKWERLVKLSRDVTVESKRIIFLLHRVTTTMTASPTTTAATATAVAEPENPTGQEGQPPPVVVTLPQIDQLQIDPNAKIFQEAEQRFETLKSGKFWHIALELQGEDPYQYLHAVRPGMQEFIEALSFHHFLKCDRLLDLKVLRKFFLFDEKPANLNAETEQDQELILPSKMGYCKNYV